MLPRQVLLGLRADAVAAGQAHKDAVATVRCEAAETASGRPRTPWPPARQHVRNVLRLSHCFRISEKGTAAQLCTQMEEACAASSNVSATGGSQLHADLHHGLAVRCKSTDSCF